MEEIYNNFSEEDKEAFWDYMDEIISYTKRFRNLGRWIDLYDMEESIFALVDMMCYNDNYHVEPE